MAWSKFKWKIVKGGIQRVSRIINPLLREKVCQEWIDYNGHMTDSAYAKVFSIAVDQLMGNIGIDADFREKHQYSIYTLETHLCYFNEAYEGQELQVTIQLLDYDTKRMHVFFTMENDKGNRLATSEQMLMGMNMKEGRPSSFPTSIFSQIESLAESHRNLSKPVETGRIIAIRKKKRKKERPIYIRKFLF